MRHSIGTDYASQERRKKNASAPAAQPEQKYFSPLWCFTPDSTIIRIKWL